jgi:hypothetical protein
VPRQAFQCCWPLLFLRQAKAAISPGYFDDQEQVTARQPVRSGYIMVITPAKAQFLFRLEAEYGKRTDVTELMIVRERIGFHVCIPARSYGDAASMFS